jgi:drug/metabolite transporter (DMT)-like permease
MRHLNLLFLVLANLMWAAQYPAYKVASDHVGVARLNFWTLLLSLVIIAPFLIRKRLGEKTAARKLSRRDIWDFVLMGIVGIIPPSVFLAWGIARSSSANAAILSLTIPILITVLAVWFVGERLTVIRVVSLVLALFGTVLISANDLTGASFQARLLAGNFVVFLACAGSAFYNAYGKRLLLRFGELEVLVYGYLVAVPACAIIALCSGEHLLADMLQASPTVWLSIGILGGLSWGLAMILWMWVLSRIDASQASVSIYLLSVFGVILSAITLHERLSLVQLVGGSLVVLGTVLTSEYEARKLARSQQVIG